MATSKISPPMVGVPFLERWVAGPDSRMLSPICLDCSQRMIRLPINKLINKDRAAANEARKVIKRKAPAPLKSQTLSK